MKEHPLERLSINARPVNKIALRGMLPEPQDGITQEQLIQNRTAVLDECKKRAWAMREGFKNASGLHGYLLNLAAMEMGYSSYEKMKMELGIKERKETDNKLLLMQNQELQLRVAELEQELSQLKKEVTP